MNKNGVFKIILLLIVLGLTSSGCKVQSKDSYLHVVNSLIQYKDGDKWGVIDINENIIVPAEYFDVQIVSDGCIIVEDENEYSALVSLEGVFLTGFDYYNLIPYCEDNKLISIIIDNRMGYINFNGEIAIDPIYSFADGFRGGLARVNFKGLEGVINTKGDWCCSHLRRA